MSDDWGAAEDPIETICEHCGEHRPCLFLRDPCRSEFQPDDPGEQSMWCRECYTGRGMDI